MSSVLKHTCFIASLWCSVVLAPASTQENRDCPIETAVVLSGHPFLARVIPCDYVKEFTPPTENSMPVAVRFALLVQDINSISAANMDFRVDLFLHMTWEDRRLNLSHLSSGQEFHKLPSYVIDYIWTPDPYVTNAKDAAITKLTTTYASVTLFRNHSVKYSARLYSRIACQMTFHGYPMDVQTCPVIMQSFMYSSKDVAFAWRSWLPVLVNPELKLLQFSLKKPLRNYVNESNEDELGHKIIQLVVEFQFSRAIGHHLIQTFVPSLLLVTLSWFSFWLGLEAIPGRVTLVVTSLLTITTLFTGIKEGLPPVGYVKAIDIWMAGCMVFIFAALGEFVVVRVLNVMLVSHPLHHHHTSHPHHMTPSLVLPPSSTDPPSPSHSASSSSFIIPPTTDGALQLPGTDKYDQQYSRIALISHGNNNNNNNNSNNKNSSNNQLHNYSNNYSNRFHINRAHSRNRKVVEPKEKSEKGNGYVGLNVGVPVGSGGRAGRAPTWDAEAGWIGGVGKPPPAPTYMRPRLLFGRLKLQWIDPKTGERKILWKEIDKASRVVFPLMFLVFMLIYFPILIARVF